MEIYKTIKCFCSHWLGLVANILFRSRTYSNSHCHWIFQVEFISLFLSLQEAARTNDVLAEFKIFLMSQCSHENRVYLTLNKESYLVDLANYGVHQVHWRHSFGYSIWLLLLDYLLQMVAIQWVNYIFNHPLYLGILKFIQCTWPLVVFVVFWLMLSLVYSGPVRCLISL